MTVETPPAVMEEGGASTPSNRHPSPAELEKLGRQRPESFETRFQEIGFCFALFASMFMAEYFISGFGLIVPVLASSLDIPPTLQTWPASIFSLIAGSFLLPFARLADTKGSYRVFVCGLAWFAISSLLCGFSQNAAMLIAFRALQGLGPAAFLPSGVMLLGSTYRPGPRKNLVFSLYGALSPVGFFAGIFFGGLTAQYLSFRWYFWLGAIVLFVVVAIAMMVAPKKGPERQDIGMDWMGAGTIVPGLVLVVYAITDSSHAPNGWANPRIYVSFVVGALFLGGAVYIEGWIAKSPLLPFDLFIVRSMVPLLISLFFSFGVFAIYLFYASLYIQFVLKTPSLLTTAYFAPMALGGLLLAITSGFTLHLLPGKVALLISFLGYLLSSLLFALMPLLSPSHGPSKSALYWAYIFPAMLGGTIGVDISYGVANIFITTSLPKSRQGLAGAVINSVLFLGMGFWLGVADLAVAKSNKGTQEGGFKVAFWLGTAASGVSLLVTGLFVKMGRAKSELTVDERRELEGEILANNA